MIDQERKEPQGETALRFRAKGPVVVWLFIMLYLPITSFLARGSSTSQLPSVLTPSLLLSLVASILIGYGPILLFFFLFVWFYEKRQQRRSVRSLLASVGLTRAGVKRSLKWALIFLVAAVPVGLVMLAIETSVAGSGAEHPAGLTSSATIPSWYFPFLIGNLLVDVVTEETIMRGYILDRLMPAHPSDLRQSLNVVLIASVMMSSYHLVPYLYTYGFSPALTGVNLVADFLYSVLISFAYIKSRARNVSGPMLFHFVLDLGTLL